VSSTEASHERPRLSQIKVELTRLFKEQVEFFRKRSLGELAPIEQIRVSEKRTKADKAQRQADQLEKKASRRPAQTRKKKPTREKFSQAVLGRSGS